MPVQRTSLNVSLTPELSAFIAAELASGRYQSASELVRAGLRLLQGADRARRPAAAAGQRRGASRARDAGP